MGTNNTAIVEGLLKWWNARFGIVEGCRNANLYKLAAAFNNYGITKAEALEVCLRYVDLTGPDPLDAGEIAATVSSAYRHTEHGVKEWTQGTRPRNYPPPRRTLTDAQARAVEDRLVEVLRKQWQTVAIPPPPTPQSAPPPPPSPVPLLSNAEILLSRWAERNPAINTLVGVLDLNLSTARITNLQTTNSPTQ